jgi:peptidoglycan/xylan/chitin deacetylase (PgdA/CDA1 family)
VTDPGRRRLLGLAGAGVVGAAAGATVVGTAASAGAIGGADGPDDAELEARQATWTEDRPIGVRRIWWSVPTTAPLLSLTFDDGPDPLFTPRILDALRVRGARATFFVMGVMLERHPDLGRRIVDEGHEIGNHTWSHENLTFLSVDDVRSQIERAHETIVDTLGVTPRWFRPPRGALPGAALRIASELGYDTAVWSVSRTLPEVGTPESVGATIVAGLEPGAIVDLHDSIGRGNFMAPFSGLRDELAAKREVEVVALPDVLGAAEGAGLRSVTLSDLVASAEA